jgi:Helix-turn-helix domain
MQLSYKYRILPTPTQAAALTTMLGDFCDLYNAGLEQRINAYRPTASSRHEIVWQRHASSRMTSPLNARGIEWM